MFKDGEAQKKYIIENFPEVTDSQKDENHWDLLCSTCDIVRGFQVIKVAYSLKAGPYADIVDWYVPQTIRLRCPVCGTYKFWLIFGLVFTETRGNGQVHNVVKWYKITSIPNDGSEEIEELPDEPTSLRIAYRQAVRAMDANAHIAAAAMFRRGLQIITRDILKAKPGTLASELKSVVGKEHNGVTVSENFSKVGYIVKEAGNQGAHPDPDPDLLDFTQQDAEDLQRIFMRLVAELFVAPEVARKTTEAFLKRRKINP